MAHFAKIENGKVVMVTPVSDDALGNDQSDENGTRILNESGIDGTWKRCSYNTQCGSHLFGGEPFRKNYPAVGFIFDEERDAFIAPKPWQSWTLNEEACCWEPPIPKPYPSPYMYWDEDSQSWQGIFNEPV